jgi:riboflavin synthase
MFTGIIMAIGSLEAITDKGDRLLRISCAWDCGTIDIGASIACSGICLTVVNTGDHWFEVAASAETMGVTTLDSWQVGVSLNLERALRLGDELGGHIVTGHVDGLAQIRSITPNGDSHIVWLEAPLALAPFVAAKGSVALDGVSLTVNEVKQATFSVNIIQHSWDVTCWGNIKTGQQMNMEIDTLARYVARLAEFNKE